MADGVQVPLVRDALASVVRYDSQKVRLIARIAASTALSAVAILLILWVYSTTLFLLFGYRSSIL